MTVSMLTGGLDARMPQWQTTVLDESWFHRAGRPRMSYRKQIGARFVEARNFDTLWPRSRQMRGGEGGEYGLLGLDAAERGSWSVPQRAVQQSGNGTTRFIRGRCQDASGNAVGGASVQCFLTSNDQFVAEVAADDKGNYEVPSVFPGVAHYLVAYRDGSPPIAGTTVNTLIPTNLDGT